MNTAWKTGTLRSVCGALALYAGSAALAESTPLGTVFYSPAERAAIVAARDGTEAKIGDATSYYTISGLVKRDGGKSVAWINGQPVTEQAQESGVPPINVTRDGVLIGGKPAKVGETLDAVSGERTSVLPPNAVSVLK